MEFRIMKASSGKYEERREINTVEELKKLAEGHPTKAGAPEDAGELKEGYHAQGQEKHGE